MRLVVHPQYGTGRIVRANDDTVVVRFLDGQRRKFEQDTAPLFSPTPQQRRDYEVAIRPKRLPRTPAAACEGCGLKPGAFYSYDASGRFCSKSCSRSFTTRAKRAEINAKISHKWFKKREAVCQ